VPKPVIAFINVEDLSTANHLGLRCLLHRIILPRTEFDAVLCPTCESRNREGRKFCAACGAALTIRCPNCGFANEPTERFCGGCGRSLVQGTSEVDKPRLSADSEGDRRPVTVLFCDLVGYTRLSSVLDPEDVHALLERFFTLVDATVERFGGTIDKHIGDAAMALFGAPLARGNDAERAVRAALDIQTSVPALASGLPSPLAVHIGIASGEVIASSVGSDHHRGYTVTGEAANVAARLLDRAAGGETLVSDAVYQATNHVASYESKGALELKGVGHPVEAWRLTGLRSSAPEAHALVGRRTEVGQFRAVLEACINGSTGTALVIRGEAGIGKTRLMDELQSIAATSGMSCIAGFVLDFGTARWHGAVRTVVAGLLGLGSDATPAAAERAIGELVRCSELQPDDALYLRDLLEIPQPDDTRRLYEAMDAATRTHGKERVIAALASAAADRRSLLVAIEDVHWADAETLNLLAAVSRATSTSRIVLVMTTRLEGDPLDAQWRSMAGGGSLITVDLAPLSPSDSLSIARRFINAAAFAEQCVERASGNPLFLEQLLRGAGDLTDGRLPASIQSVVLARTDLLPAQDRRAIQAASALGQRFSLADLRALLREPQYSCDTLLRNALLRPTRDGLQFAHALVRDGVYGSLTHARRRELHRAAATIFADDPVLRAEHLDRAGDAEAPRAYLAAAEAQAKLFRHDQAISLASRGLALAVERRDTFELAMLVGDLQQDAGRGTEALEAYLRAEAGDDAERCRSLIGRTAANRLIARLDDAFSALAEAEPLADTDKNDRALAEIHYLRGNLHFARGQLAECRTEHQSALLAAKRLDSPEWQARALSGLADAQYMDCRMATALRHFSECVDLCEAQGLTKIAIPNLVMMGHCRIYTCVFDVGLNDMRVAMESAARIGNRHAEMFATHSIGFSLTAAGRYAEAANVQPTAREQARALKARRYEAVILSHCAEVALSKGQKREALALTREGLEISEQTGPGFAGPILYGLLALLDDHAEDQEAALKAGETLLEKGSVGHNHFWFRRYAIERALLLGNWNEVDRQANALLRRMTDEPLPYATYVAERGQLLARRGRRDVAQTDDEKLAKLLTSTNEIGMRIEALGEALRQN
jgi:class 3 adenylate cyclase/tetratricopeptide (TPR) repeat protein